MKWHLFLYPYWLLYALLNGTLKCALTEHNFIPMGKADEHLISRMLEKGRNLQYLVPISGEIEICRNCASAIFPHNKKNLESKP